MILKIFQVDKDKINNQDSIMLFIFYKLVACGGLKFFENSSTGINNFLLKLKLASLSNVGLDGIFSYIFCLFIKHHEKNILI